LRDPVGQIAEALDVQTFKVFVIRPQAGGVSPELFQETPAIHGHSLVLTDSMEMIVSAWATACVALKSRVSCKRNAPCPLPLKPNAKP
jgi:hypothetical protein